MAMKQIKRPNTIIIKVWPLIYSFVFIFVAEAKTGDKNHKPTIRNAWNMGEWSINSDTGLESKTTSDSATNRVNIAPTTHIVIIRCLISINSIPNSYNIIAEPRRQGPYRVAPRCSPASDRATC